MNLFGVEGQYVNFNKEIQQSIVVCAGGIVAHILEHKRHGSEKNQVRV
jgi:hypothetical protein